MKRRRVASTRGHTTTPNVMMKIDTRYTKLGIAKQVSEPTPGQYVRTLKALIVLMNINLLKRLGTLNALVRLCTRFYLLLRDPGFGYSGAPPRRRGSSAHDRVPERN